MREEKSPHIGDTDLVFCLTDWLKSDCRLEPPASAVDIITTAPAVIRHPSLTEEKTV
jgi:hypothetical protein